MQEPMSYSPAVDRPIAYAESGAPIRWFAYIGDFSAVATAAGLLNQKRAIDHYAVGRSMHIERYVVDSGMVVDTGCIAFNLRQLFTAACRSEIDGIVVEHVSRFASDYALALRIAAAFSMQGVSVVEARGGLVVIDAEVARTLADDAFGAGALVETTAAELYSGLCH